MPVRDSVSTIPSRALSRTADRSDLLFRWTARDLSLDARTGQSGTFARASTGGAVLDENLRLSGQFVDGQERFGFYDANGTSEPALRLSGARTNGKVHSEDLTDASYSPVGASITANATEAPDGATTADKLVEDSSASSLHRVAVTGLPAGTDNTDQTYSVFLKAAERNWVALRTTDKSNTQRLSYIDLSDGTTGTVDGGHTIRITSLADDWYRVAVTFDSASGATALGFGVRLADSDGGQTYSGDGSSGAYAWGIQAEADTSFASEYKKTEGSTTAQVAESLSWTFNHAPQAMTVYLRFVELGTILASGYAFEIGSNVGAGDSWLELRGNSGVYRIIYDNGTTLAGESLAGAPSFADLEELRVTLNANGAAQVHQSINGATETSSSATADLGFADAWSSQTFVLNGGGVDGFAAYTDALVLPGVVDLATCRTRAGL